MKNIKYLFGPMLIIIIVVIIRLFPHMPNFTPIGAMALFGGCYLNKKYSIALVILAMVVSDYLLLYVNPFSPSFINISKLYSPLALIHSTTAFVYGSFILTAFVGLWLRENKSVRNIIGASLFSSIIFFLITNAGVWIVGAYDRSILGLWESYVMGIPFFRPTLLGDLFYTGVFFGGYELALLIVRNYAPVSIRQPKRF